MITIYAHENGSTRLVERVEPDWLRHDSGVWVWVDIINPDPGEVRILTDVFKFHELAIEDAIAEIHHPKIESYGDYLYVILHGIDFKAREHAFHTQDVDFFLSDRLPGHRSSGHLAIHWQGGRYLHAEQPGPRGGPGGADAPHHRHDGG